jgi:FixJ family two-component response regulator
MSANGPPRVFLVDDDAAVRDALELVLRAAGLVVCAFDSAESFVRAYSPDLPGCLVLDIHLPGMDGLALQAKFAQEDIALPIIMISGQADIATAVGSMRKGAVSFIEKPFDTEELVRLVREALARDADARRLAQQSAAGDVLLAALSPREREVLDRVLAGKTSRAIAEELSITLRTVEFHRGRIMEKLQVGTLAELFRIALPRT